MAEQEKLARLKATRKSHRGGLNRYMNEANAIADNTRTDESQLQRLQILKTQIEQKSNSLSKVDGDILQICDVTDIEKEVDETEAISLKLTELMAKIEKILKIERNETSDVDRANTSFMSSSSDTRSRSKLPKLDLQKFNGDILKFPQFWDRFETAIDKNPDIPTVEKFNYLQYYLEGAAARNIDGLLTTEANYESAKETLKKRYGRPQMIITAHVEEIYKLKPCNNGDKTIHLRYVYDKISAHVRGIEGLGVELEYSGCMLVPIIMAKLPYDIRVQLARVTSREIWSLKELLETLRTEVEAREDGDAVKVNESRPGMTNVANPTRNTATALFSEAEEVSTRNSCIYCTGDHFSASCEAVTDVNKRKDILRNLGRCFVCLRTGHMLKDCTIGRNCRICGKRHHQSICFGKVSPKSQRKGEEMIYQVATEREEPNSAPTTSASASTKSKSRVLLQTARTIAFKEGEKVGIPIRILLDNGSQRTYITEDLQRKLGLKPSAKETVHLNTFGGEGFSKNICQVVKLELQGVNSERIQVNALSFPKLCSPLPARVDLNDYPHLENLELADCFDCDSDSESVDMLIGSDMYFEVVTGDIIRGDEGLIAVSSKFGWLLSGPVKVVNDYVTDNISVSNLIIEGNAEPKNMENEIIATELKRFWDTESIGIHDFAGNESKTKFLGKVNHDGSRYEVGLPWKQVEPEPLSDNYSLALGRLNSLWNRLEKDSVILKEYDSIITDQLNSGILEKVPENEQTKDFAQNNTIHYLSHFGVVRKDSETTKLRIVFDGSAKSEGEQLSINDYLENGPNLIPPIFEIVTKFRSYPIAIVSDIEKAFLQISIEEKDRDALRFLWYRIPEDGQEPKLIHLRFRRLVWGLKPSPSILGHVINEHLEKFENVEPQVVQLLKRQLFVDDFVGGAKTVQEGLKIYSTSKKIMESGGFNLRKWKTSSLELSKMIEEEENFLSKAKVENVQEDDDSYVKEKLGSQSQETNERTKVLGLNWDISDDAFFFDFAELIEYANSLPPTKRSVLKITAKIFDPMGFLTPITVSLKEMFQTLCIENVNWDDKLEGEFRSKFDSIVFDLARLHNLRIPRCLFVTNKPVKTFELHGFSDASISAHAATVYLLSRYDDGTVTINLIASKSRVSPIHKQSIPRLELLGAVILSRLMDNISASLESVFGTKLKCFYWTDSNVVLCWIQNVSIWKTYVQNRVNEIRKTSSVSEWGFCPGKLNPADIPSRGMKSNDLVKSDLWWHGPDFLKLGHKNWPKQPKTETAKLEADEEIAKTKGSLVTHVLSSTENENGPKIAKIIQVERFSTKSKVIRTLAWVLRFIVKLKCRVNKEQIPCDYRNENLSVTEVEFSELTIVKGVQDELFHEEIAYLSNKNPKCKPPRLVSEFGLFIDEKGVMRCRTRLKNANVVDGSKLPIFLHGKHYFSKLVIREVHANVAHSGVRHTLSVVRERFWILRGRDATRRIVRQCIICRRFGEPPFATLPSFDLPSFRVDDGPPFSNIGVDFAGPLFISNKGNESKVYICLFTCASTRAVHLELVESLHAESFLCCFRRFAARRGLPRLIVSDNAKTFKYCSKEIYKIVRSPVVQEYFVKKGIEWRFIPELSPWFGSYWERLVGSVKRCLRRVIGQSKLSYDEMQTVLVEAEGVVNSRPITYVYGDSEGVSYALSPSHLIYGRRITSEPSDSLFEIVSTNESLTRRAKHHRKLLAQFTKIWREEYLVSLRERASKNRASEKPDIEVGDVVLLKSDKTRRGFWKLARVEELIPGGDGEIRVGRVKVLSNDNKLIILRRSITHLIPLEVRAERKDRGTADVHVGKTRDRNTAGDEQRRPRRTAAVIGEIRRKDQQM